jgi:hypothetical protein
VPIVPMAIQSKPRLVEPHRFDQRGRSRRL